MKSRSIGIVVGMEFKGGPHCSPPIGSRPASNLSTSNIIIPDHQALSLCNTSTSPVSFSRILLCN